MEVLGRMRRWKGRKARKEKKIIQTMGMKRREKGMYTIKANKRCQYWKKSRAKPVTRSAN